MDIKERRRICERKREYPTRKKARINAQRAKGLNGEKMYYYKCPFCKMYHLTRTNPKLSAVERLALKANA